MVVEGDREHAFEKFYGHVSRSGTRRGVGTIAQVKISEVSSQSIHVDKAILTDVAFGAESTDTERTGKSIAGHLGGYLGTMIGNQSIN